MVIIIQIASVALYLYTIFLAYQLSGLFVAVLTACLPPLSNFYWIYDRWDVTGSFFNFYTQVNLAYVALLLCHALFFLRAKKELH